MTTVTAPSVDTGQIIRMPIHFDDLDAMGIVHNARYAVMLERALTTYWAEQGVSFADGRPTTSDVFNVVREFSITYHQPIRGTGEVAVHFWIDRLGESSAVYGFAFRSADLATLFADGRRVNIKVDPKTMRPTAWTEGGNTIATRLLR